MAIIFLYGEDVTEQQLATDQMLLHFSNLSMHMNGELVLRKVNTSAPLGPSEAAGVSRLQQAAGEATLRRSGLLTEALSRSAPCCCGCCSVQRISDLHLSY